MSSHRAAYLRRAIPRLSERYKPRYEVHVPYPVTREQEALFRQLFGEHVRLTS